MKKIFITFILIAFTIGLCGQITYKTDVNITKTNPILWLNGLNGQLKISGATSGTAIIKAKAVAGTPTFTIPSTTGVAIIDADTAGMLLHYLHRATTVGSAFLNLANPSAITFPRIDAANTVTARSAANFKADLSLENVTNESKATMFNSPTITGHPTFEGVTATGATGTGNMVFSATPTFTGTLGAANISATGGIQGKGEFNIIQYGAVTNDGLEDNTALQAAIQAAYAYAIAGQAGTSGTVIIPPGYWLITDSITLRSYVNIKASSGARLYFVPTTPRPFYINPGNQALEHCMVQSGHYRLPTAETCNWIEFTDNNVGNCVRNTFMDAEVVYADNVFKSDGSTDVQTTNSSVLSNITAYYCKTFSNLKGTGGNVFDNCVIQTDVNTDSLFVFYGSCGTNNFTDIVVWDYTAGVGYYFSDDTEQNYLQYTGHSDATTNIDLGNQNYINVAKWTYGSQFNITRNYDDQDYTGEINFLRAKDGTPTRNVANEDRLGVIDFKGYHTDAFLTGARIIAEVHGTPGHDDMPGRLDFYTTPDGSATPVLNMTIRQEGTITTTGALSVGTILSASNVTGYSTTATATGVTTLSVASNRNQFFTGTLTQTVVMPVVSTLGGAGFQFTIFNNSTQLVTIQSSGGGTVIILASGTRATLTSIATSGTTPAVWDCKYFGLSITSGKILSASNSLTLAGTDATTMTFPTTSATIARTDAGHTFTGNHTVNGTLILGANDITMTGSLASTGSRVTKGWFTDIDVTNDVDIADVAISGSIIKKTIGWHGAAGVNFLLPDIASHGDYPIDLGAIVPAKARVKSVEIVCTEAVTAAGAIDITMGAGNATGGAQFIVALSCDDLNEVVGIIDPHLPAAVVMNWAAATNIWILANPDVNYDTMTAGKWAVYVTYEYYGAL